MKLLLTIFGVTSIVYGVAWVAWTLSWSESYSWNAPTDAVVIAKALENLRDGNLNDAIGLLENTLDGKIIASTLPGTEIRKAFPSILGVLPDLTGRLCKVAPYRIQHPSPDSEIQQSVAEALSACNDSKESK
jgi:hypothetical protein